MIDVPATLAPATGVALRYAVSPPHAGDPLWSSAVELPPVDADFVRDGADVPLSARFAGASGPSRTDALLRGAGEAVERRALHPSAALPARRGTAAELGALTLDAYHPGHALAHPDAATAVLEWHEARALDTDATVLVPADLVNWPARNDVLFDPSPSGAAAGAGPDAALGAALVEVAERDALTVAWGRQLRLPTHTPAPEDTRLRAVWQQAEAEGLRPVLARIPVAATGLWCMTALLIEPDAPGDTVPLAAVGMKASTRPAEAAVKAFQEARQVRAALRALRAQGETGPRGPLVVTEHDRLCHMLTRRSYDAVRAWADGFQEPVPLPGPSAAPPLPVRELTESMNADGAALLAVDLTPRLPAPVAAMGWKVMKVLAPGYQNLRMDETHRWSWHLPRLASAPDRTGCPARLDDPRDAAPHPLP
ncbi:YcaO-like family protein [Streptomyces sp. NRRL F-5727]|uniref:YcaO-like family protein n=1 Tax=Streptomyces sp. NRRL F-5727 TaxID=1463871 RepID=UPI0004C4EBF4|nr:YcaO-like family protein [Streptomyces sp. NRRL F-5727]